jgi:hypothetical protein
MTREQGKEQSVGNYKSLGRLWQPSAETLESIAAVLSRHWRGAVTDTGQLFWPKPVSWVRPPSARAQAQRVAAHHHLTSGGRLMR